MKNTDNNSLTGAQASVVGTVSTTVPASYLARSFSDITLHILCDVVAVSTIGCLSRSSSEVAR